ncbi:MAG: AmmeMemoRadiSam system radical SAM enzyme [Treponema sp.]|jgi:pyruvate formate lyase activating enzyme|nr:AmmeMemoRadiSam system radical SAM enzyme [Treponema sp.]
MMQKEALFYEKNGETVTCGLCPRRCVLREGQTGFCSARVNSGGTLFAENYGRISSIALDPIEKKPLKRFFPGSVILSAGSYGCTMSCAFCQNFSISQMKPRTDFLPPEKLLEAALSIPGNLGIAFTYNEPFTGIEYILDVAPLLRKRGLKTVLVTNGMILEEPLSVLLPLVDAMNIDLKAFSPEFYQRHNGSFETVKKTIETCAQSCHVEVTTLIVPDENDSEEEMAALAGWLASVPSASGGIPLHITRFFPRFKMKDKQPTPLKTVFSLVDRAKQRLTYVYAGNVN